MVNSANDRVRAEIMDMGATCFALQARKTANQIARIYNNAVADLGLEMSQISTLFLIAVEGADTMARAADVLGVERSTLVRNIGVLQRDGFVTRSTGVGVAGYRLTASGRTMVEKAIPRWQSIQQSIERQIAQSNSDDPRPGMRALRRAAKLAVAERNAS